MPQREKMFSLHACYLLDVGDPLWERTWERTNPSCFLQDPRAGSTPMEKDLFCKELESWHSHITIPSSGPCPTEVPPASPGVLCSQRQQQSLAGFRETQGKAAMTSASAELPMAVGGQEPEATLPQPCRVSSAPGKVSLGFTEPNPQSWFRSGEPSEADEEIFSVF